MLFSDQVTDFAQVYFKATITHTVGSAGAAFWRLEPQRGFVSACVCMCVWWVGCSRSTVPRAFSFVRVKNGAGGGGDILRGLHTRPRDMHKDWLRRQTLLLLQALLQSAAVVVNRWAG